jgi:hypothetical protein
LIVTVVLTGFGTLNVHVACWFFSAAVFPSIATVVPT